MKKIKDQSVEAILAKEQKKNRILATVLISAAFLVAGIVLGHFGTVEITAQANSRVVNSIVVSAEPLKANQ